MIFFQQWRPIELLQSIFQEPLYSQLASLVINVLEVGRTKTYSLISAHCLLGVNFLTTMSDKCMCFLTRLYGMYEVVHFLSSLDSSTLA